MKTEKRMKQIFMLIISAVLFMTMPQVMLQNSISTVEAATVKMNYKKLTLKVGASKKLVLKNATGKIKWKSKKKSIATVSAKGLVKAKKAGKTTITATLNEKEYKCILTVKKKSSSSNTGSNSGTGAGNGVVYWTPGGSVYHVSRNCPTLSRSKIIYHGTVSGSGKSRACKVCS